VRAQDPSAASRVVGFKVEPFSVRHTFASPSSYWDGTPSDMPPLSTCEKDNFVNPVKLQTVRLDSVSFLVTSHDVYG